MAKTIEYMCALPSERSAEILGSDPSRGWAAANGCPPEIAKKIIEYRSAIIAGKDEVEARSVFSRATVFVQRTVNQASDLAQLAWKQFTSNPAEFRRKHGTTPEVDDSAVRRRQLFDLIS